MSKVIQIRDVPDDVHADLVQVAESRGLSLTGFLRSELVQPARRPDVVQHNADVIRRTQSRVRGTLSQAAIQEALEKERGGRWRWSTPAWSSSCSSVTSNLPCWATTSCACHTWSTAKGDAAVEGFAQLVLTRFPAAPLPRVGSRSLWVGPSRSYPRGWPS